MNRTISRVVLSAFFCLSFLAASATCRATIYQSSPAPRVWTSTGNLVYKLQIDTSTGTGTTISNGLIRFRVSSESGNPFLEDGTVQIRLGSVNGTIVKTIPYNAGVTITPWSSNHTLGFTSGSQTFYATRLDSSPSQISSGGVVVSVTPSNPLGVDLSHLDGKRVRGPLVFGATNASATTLAPWSSFNLRSGNASGPVIAQTYVGGGTDSVLSEVAWRMPDGTYISQWSDLLSGSTTLVLEGIDSLGQVVQSSPFTVTPQTTLNVTIPSPSGASFPTVVPSNTTSFNPSFSASVSGNSGSASYAWFYRSTTTAATTSGFSPTFTGSGVHLVTVRVSDTNNNVTWAQYIAPVAKRLDYGNPSISRSGSVLAGPVDVVSGNLHLLTEDLSVDCFGVPFALTRSYNSRPGANSAQWLFGLEEYALTEFLRTNQSDFNGRGLKIVRSDGSPQEYFLDSSGNYRPINPGNFDIAVETGTGASREIKIYESGGVVRTYVKSPIPINANNYSGTFWTLKSIKSPRGHGITLNHSSTASYLGVLPRITSVTDAANRTYNVSYDGSGRINQVSDFTGRNVAYTWDSNNNITAFVDVRGYTTNYSYRTSSPGNKRLLAIQAPRTNYPIQAIGYDSSDRVTSFQDGDGYSTSYSYATSSTTVTPPVTQERIRYTINSTTKAITGVIESYGYGNYTTSLSVRSSAAADAIANYSLIDGKTDPANRSTSLGYASNTRGQVNSITGNDGKTASISYNNLDLSRNLYAPSSVTSRANRVYDMETNNFGEITRSEDAANNATTTAYNSYGLPATISDALGRNTTVSYNSAGYPTQITDALGNSIVITNDSLGRPTRVVDRRGYKTDFTYDADGNVLTISDHLNNQVVNGYDANGNLNSTRDRRGNLTLSSYNNRDLPFQISRNAPLNGTLATITETNYYDGMGRVIQTSNGRGNSTTQSFTNRGQVASVSNGAGEVVLSMTYNSDGSVATRTTGSGASASTITFGYDSLGRQISATDSLGNQVQTSYNDDHQVTGTRDARGFWTIMAYDTAARLASITDANGAVSRLYYDAVGNVTQVQDPRGFSTHHVYDSLNRRTQERDELNRVWAFTYDPEGNLLTESFPDGRVFTSYYDSLGRLDYVAYGGPRFADFDYDADGNMTTLIDHVGISGFTWDSMNRLQSAHDPYGQTVSYLYDAASNRTRITYPGSRIVNYSYDSAERLSSVSPWAGGTFTYSWRADGKLSQLTNGNGTYTSYGYDAAARLTSMITRAGAGSVFIAQNFTLDPNGNITRITGEQPTPPPSGLTKSMTFDNTNRLLTDDGSLVTHDAAGRMTSNPTSSGGAATFVGRDWLASFTPTGGSTTSYAYNGFGQRLSRTQGATTSRYLLDQNQELPAVLAENDGSNSPQRFYIHGIGLLASIDTANNVRTYHPNHRGDILALTNASGTVTESYGYSPYGLTAASNPLSTNPFRFGGALGVMDEGNGLHFMRARYYNASLGRFLSMDQLPGGLDNPQSLDRFAYALGNPMSNVDPSGYEVADYYDDYHDALNSKAAAANRRALIEEKRGGDASSARKEVRKYKIMAAKASKLHSAYLAVLNEEAPSGDWEHLLRLDTAKKALEKEIHLNRNILNAIYHDEKSVMSLRWTLAGDDDSVFHRIGPGNEFNRKYVDPTGRFELVFKGGIQGEGVLVQDGVNDGTFNFTPKSQGIAGHYFDDIAPWIMWGTSSKDSTSNAQRWKLLMSTGLYEKIKAVSKGHSSLGSLTAGF